MSELAVPPTAAGDAVVQRSGTARLAAVDRLRGLVIVLMAIDHVRHYFYRGAFTFDPLDPAHSDLALYLTRWITDLCAPTFVFLAGVSAFLQTGRGKSGSQLSRSLLARGLWLVFLELTVVSFAWSFSIPYWIVLQVIWAIGWAMLALALLVRLPRKAVLAVGIVIVAGHNLLDPLTPEEFGSLAWLWRFLHVNGPIVIDGATRGVLVYPVLPWIGIMALGYGLGPLFTLPDRRRDRWLLGLGAAMVLLFLALRSLNLYGDYAPWTAGEDLLGSAMHFLDLHKYPPSLHYALLFLGIAFLLLPLLARLTGLAGRVLQTFGAVPFFFYVLHLYLAHALAIAANAALGRDVAGLFDVARRMLTEPQDSLTYGFGLAGTYAAWLAVVILLYPPCRWYARLKRERRAWWMSYL